MTIAGVVLQPEDRVCAHAVLAGEASDLGTAFGVLQDPNELGFCESTLSPLVPLNGCALSSQELLERLTGTWSDRFPRLYGG